VKDLNLEDEFEIKEVFVAQMALLQTCVSSEALFTPSSCGKHILNLPGS
jgi:hypothetical protein